MLPVVVVRQQPMQPAPSEEAGRLDHRVSHREEGDALTGAGQRWVMALASAPIEDTNSLARRDFPIPGVTQHREAPHGAGADHAPKRGAQSGQLALAAKHRRVERAWDGRRAGDDLQDLPARCPSRSAVEGLHDHRPSEQPLRCRPDDDLVVRRCLLQPSRRPHHGPRDGIAERGPGPRDHDVAHFDARPRPVEDTLERRWAVVQRHHGRLRIGNGAHRSERVVLVRHGNPKNAIRVSPSSRSTRPPCRSITSAATRAQWAAEAPDGLGIRVRVCSGGDVEDRDRHSPPLPGKPGPRRTRGPVRARSVDGKSSAGSCLRIAVSSSRRAGPGSRPSSSTSSERVSRYARRASA